MSSNDLRTSNFARSEHAAVAVVIPYFQRDAGILRKALASVFAQDYGGEVEVIVVDDGSPAPPEPEIESFGRVAELAVKVVRQQNGGPGAARNAALDRIPVHAQYVAFLDSDDTWSPDHISSAVAALAQGYDLYFSDLHHIDQVVSAFERAKRITPADHPVLPGCAHLHEYRGDMIHQIISGNVIGTPTVVYAFHRFADLRFRDEFRYAREDYLFWMELCRRGARFAFSERCDATCGKGVNVYSGSGWGTDTHGLRIHNEMRYRKATMKEFNITEAQRSFLVQKIRELRKAFARDTLHRLRHRKPIDRSLIAAHVRLDALTIPAIMTSFVELMFAQLRERS